MDAGDRQPRRRALRIRRCRLRPSVSGPPRSGPATGARCASPPIRWSRADVSSRSTQVPRSARLQPAARRSGPTAWCHRASRRATPPAAGSPMARASLFVSSGFGLMTALDPATGAEIWQQNLRATGSGSPTVSGDLVYLVAGDDTAWALDTENGRIRWQLSAAPDINNVLGGPAPADNEQICDLRLRLGRGPGGLPSRVGCACGMRRLPVSGGGMPMHAWAISPAIPWSGTTGSMWAVSRAAWSRLAWPTASGCGPRIRGRSTRSGRRRDSIFMVSDRNELVRLQAEDGAQVWAVKMPFFTKTKPRRQSEIFAHHGPIIAGGQLIVASGDGLLRFFDPVIGGAAAHRRVARRRDDQPGGGGRDALRGLRRTVNCTLSVRPAILLSGRLDPTRSLRHEFHPRHRGAPQCGQVHAVQPPCRQASGAGRRPAGRDPRPARGHRAVWAICALP